MKSKEELRRLLDRVYRQRKAGISVTTTEEFRALLAHSEREFYFFLMHSYLYDTDLSDIIKPEYSDIRLAVGYFCDIAERLGFPDIKKYYDKFMVTNESSQQIHNVINELNIMIFKEQMIKQYHLEDLMH